MKKPRKHQPRVTHLSTTQLATIVGGQFKGNIDMERAAPPAGVPQLA